MSKELVKECGLGAILAVVAYTVGFAVFASAGEPPGPGNMPALLSFLSDHRTNLIIALWVFAIAAILNLGALPAIYQLLHEKVALVSMALAASVVGFIFSAIFLMGSLGIAYELAPAYVTSGEAARPALEAIGATLWTTGGLVHTLSHVFFWGIGAAVFAYVSLRVRAVPAWAAWLGLIGSVLTGYPGALESVSSVKELASLAEMIGTTLYVVWLAAMGIAALRYQEPARSGARS